MHIVKVIWTNICRFLLAILFIFSGFVKAVDPLGTVYKIQDYLEAFGFLTSLSSIFVLVLAISLATLEFLIGVLLLFGVRRDMSVLLVLGFMILMTPLTLYLAIVNPISDCGCFGDAWVLTNWQTFGKNLLLLGAAITVFGWKSLIISFVSAKSEWLISLYTVFFIVALSLYCYNRLPILDFRPYKIGVNIPEAMEIPQGVEVTEYETIFILEKGGKKQEFTLANYPDSTWSFVDARTVVKKEGYEPSIQDFSIIEQRTGEEIATQILLDANYTFLLVSHRLEEASDSNIDLINEIYDYSVEYGYSFYCLTASPDYQIEIWKDKSGAEYSFGLMDDITLKTMIRSNPGLILMKDGTILNKWSHKDLPDEYILSDTLGNLDLGKQKEVRESYVIGGVMLWFIIPLFCVGMLDMFFIRRRKKKESEEIVN